MDSGCKLIIYLAVLKTFTYVPIEPMSYHPSEH